MSGAWPTQRWVLVAAGSCALAGVVLKMSDFGGRSTPPAGPVTARSVPPSSPPPRLASRGDEPSPTVAADGGVGSERGAQHGTQPDTDMLLHGRDGAATHPASDGGRVQGEVTSLGHRHGREGGRSRTGGGAGASLEVGAVGSEPGEGGGTLAADGTGHAAGQHGAVATPGQTADKTEKPDAASGPPDVAFASDASTTYPTNEQVEIPNLDKLAGNTGTLSFWLQPSWQDGNQDDASLMSIGDGRLEVIKNVNFLRFEFTDDAGAKDGLGAPITQWKEGEWHQVTATWSGDTYSLYLDGQLVSQTVHPGLVDLPPDTKLSIGSDFPENRPVAPGVIGRVDVHNRPLAPGEIARQYQLASNSTK